jgi:hypothetical protein
MSTASMSGVRADGDNRDNRRLCRCLRATDAALVNVAHRDDLNVLRVRLFDEAADMPVPMPPTPMTPMRRRSFAPTARARETALSASGAGRERGVFDEGAAGNRGVFHKRWCGQSFDPAFAKASADFLHDARAHAMRDR